MANLDKLADVANRFTYHKPFGNQPGRYQVLRSAAKRLAELILEVCPESREQSLALTHLQEAAMWANAAIACNEKEEDICTCGLAADGPPCTAKVHAHCVDKTSSVPFDQKAFDGLTKETNPNA